MSDEYEENISLPTTFDSRLINSSRDDRASIYLRMEKRAELDAARQVQSDINKYKRGEELPTIDLIQDEATLKALESINYSDIQKGDIDIEPLREHYIQTFMGKYEGRIEHEIGTGILLSEESKRIRKDAQVDRLEHEQEGKCLSDFELTCHAAIRAQEHFGLDTRTTDYLVHILKYTQTYKQAYREEKIDRSPRSDPFLGGGWQGR